MEAATACACDPISLIRSGLQQSLPEMPRRFDRLRTPYNIPVAQAMKCRAKRVHAPRSRPLFTRVVHAARSPSTQRRSRPPFTRFCNVHALCSRIYRPVHAHRSRFRCTVHAFGAPFTRGAHPFTRTATPVRRTGRVSLPEPSPSPRRSARRRRRRRGHGLEELGVWWTFRSAPVLLHGRLCR